MSKAESMFKELGYEKYENFDNDIGWRKDYGCIVFNLDNKTFWTDDFYLGTKVITLDELAAINEFAKELGWLDE